FAVRNSGAIAVVEGVGSNGCEYMTGGTVVILGEIGDNFGAGFTGGQSFVYDPEQKFEMRVNPETLQWQRVSTSYWEDVLKNLVTRHASETQSRFAATLLNDWDRALPCFWQIVPREYVKYLAAPLNEEVAAARA
ncbi:MAG: hypothetical protein B7Z71_09650, partial [Acidocella sp. 21-58-7]